MSGPIIRTGTNPKFWEGWDKVFGNAVSTDKTPAKKSKKTTAPKTEAAAVKATKKAAKKAAKKAPAKKKG